jgi:hypothetical protein
VQCHEIHVVIELPDEHLASAVAHVDQRAYGVARARPSFLGIPLTPFVDPLALVPGVAPPRRWTKCHPFVSAGAGADETKKSEVYVELVNSLV